MADKFEVRTFDGPLGKAAVARSAICRGEVVLIEQPLLVAPRVTSLAVAQVEAGVALPQLVCQLVAYAAAPPDIRARVLSEFYHPVLGCPGADPDGPRAAARGASAPERELVLECGRVARAARAALPALAAHTVSELQRVALVFASNVHAHPSGSALHALGSKVAHSCAPSLRFHGPLARSDGAFSHVALRDVKAGELLGVDYHGAGLMPAPVRRRLTMATKHFLCCCHRCRWGADVCRALPCPACCPRGPTGRLAADASGAHPPQAHAAYVMPDMALFASHDPRPWVCSNCGGRWADDESSLMGGADAITALRAWPPVAAVCARYATQRWETLKARAAAGGVVAPAAPRLATIERSLEDAVDAYDRSLAGPSPDPAWSDISSLYEAATGVLGGGHGATRKVQRLLVEVAGTTLRAIAAAPGVWSAPAAAAAAGARVAALVRHVDDAYTWATRVSAGETAFCALGSVAPLARGAADALMALATAGDAPLPLRARAAGLARALYVLRILPVWRWELGDDSPAVADVLRCGKTAQALSAQLTRGAPGATLADILPGLELQPWAHPGGGGEGHAPPGPAPPLSPPVTAHVRPRSGPGGGVAVAVHHAPLRHTVREVISGDGAPTLEVVVHLPMMTSAGAANLNVTAREVVLSVGVMPPGWHPELDSGSATPPALPDLRVALPFAVDDALASAKFNRSTKLLTILLPAAPGANKSE